MTVKNAAPLFIIGSSRSGTELMVGILNKNPNVLIANETHYFDDLRLRIKADKINNPDSEILNLANIYFAQLRAGAYALHGTERPEDGFSDPHLPIISIDKIFQEHCLRSAPRLGKNKNNLAYWGEKTPRHVFCVKDILSAFPDARFIYMLRDPRAVVASYRDWKNHYIDPSQAAQPLQSALASEEMRVRQSFSIGIATMIWRRANATARQWQSKLGDARFRIQKFEDLLADPRGQIAEICAMLDIAPDPRMLQVGRLNSSYGHNDKAGVDPNARSAWRNRMTDAEAWTVEMLCHGPMLRDGYARASKRAHPGFLIRELIRTTWRVPLAFAANRHRMGNPFVWVMRRVTT